MRLKETDSALLLLLTDNDPEMTPLKKAFFEGGKAIENLQGFRKKSAVDLAIMIEGKREVIGKDKETSLISYAQMILRLMQRAMNGDPIKGRVLTLKDTQCLYYQACGAARALNGEGKVSSPTGLTAERFLREAICGEL